MKKYFEKPKMEVIFIDDADIIATSPNTDTPIDPDPTDEFA